MGPAESMQSQIQRLAQLRAGGSTGGLGASEAMAMANAKASQGGMLPEPPSNEMIEKLRASGMSIGQILALLKDAGIAGGAA